MPIAMQIFLLVLVVSFLIYVYIDYKDTEGSSYNTFPVSNTYRSRSSCAYGSGSRAETKETMFQYTTRKKIPPSPPPPPRGYTNSSGLGSPRKNI